MLCMLVFGKGIHSYIFTRQFPWTQHNSRTHMTVQMQTTEDKCYFDTDDDFIINKYVELFFL